MAPSHYHTHTHTHTAGGQTGKKPGAVQMQFKLESVWWNDEFSPSPSFCLFVYFSLFFSVCNFFFPSSSVLTSELHDFQPTQTLGHRTIKQHILAARKWAHYQTNKQPQQKMTSSLLGIALFTYLRRWQCRAWLQKSMVVRHMHKCLHTVHADICAPACACQHSWPAFALKAPINDQETWLDEEIDDFRLFSSH